ncbi:MAG: COX15/CtaA family protein [Saprospiraceae bacterium]|nr:COX15/CtaA family protein [Saprospiraceae bacterium]
MKFSRVVYWWLLLGVLLVYCQIVIGGVTRLTGSGLSITKWEIVTGTLPPMNAEKWIEEFNEYKATPQYEKLNKGMSLKEFKFIYFWEYFHRLWARMMGFVFVFPFAWFFARRKLPSATLKDLGIVILLAASAASFGWIMVASGLVNRPWVNAYKLSIHLLIGIAVFIYLLWSVLKYRLQVFHEKDWSFVANKYALALIGLMVIQILFGGWMSGMRAALVYPTWPDIGGHFIPPDVLSLSNWSWSSFVEYDRSSFVFGLVHFLHRGIAYLILLLAAHYMLKKDIWANRGIIRKSYVIFLLLLLSQVVIGIVTLLTSVGQIPVLWGVLHQGIAVLVLASLVMHYFYWTRQTIK